MIAFVVLLQKINLFLNKKHRKRDVIRKSRKYNSFLECSDEFRYRPGHG